MRTRLRALLPAVACILCACSGGAPPRSAGPLPAAEARLLVSEGSSADQAELSNAVERLTQQCMGGKGLTYFPSYVPSQSAGTGNSLPEFPVYSGTPARRADGYGLYENAVKAAAAAEHQPVSRPPIPAQSQAYDDALYGPPGQTEVIDLPGGPVSTARSGGCRAAAVTRLYGSVRSYIFAIEGAPLIHNYFITQVETAPAFKAAIRRWQECMHAAGFTFSAPSAAFDDVAQRYGTYGPTRSLRRREITIAVADQACATRVSLIEITTGLQDKVMVYLSTTVREQLRTISRTDQLALSKLPHMPSANS